MVEPTGYILLSATENDFPVSHWSSRGTPISTELEKDAENSGKNAAKFYELDTLSYAAEDSSGELVATLGELPPKLMGLGPASLKSEGSEGSEFIMTSGNWESDDKVDTERSVKKTGPEESPIQILNWTSWAELKAGYAQTYAVLLDKQKMDAAKDWEIDNQARKFGEGLIPGDTYKLPFLYPNAQYDISGEGKNYASFNLIDRQDMPSVLEITANSAPPNGQAEIDIVITYEKEGQEYLKFVVLDPNIVKQQQEDQAAPMYPRTHYLTSNMSDEKTEEELMKLRIQQNWGPWETYWAGSDEDQRNYYQFPYRGCQVGCGPVAWAMLLGWVDHQASIRNPIWTGYWGLYRQGGGCNGPDADAPQDMDAGVEQMIEQIRDCVGTFCLLDNGATMPTDMGGITNYVSCRSNIGTASYASIPLFQCNENSRDRAKNAIQFQGIPVILGVGIAQHYPLAYGYMERSRTVRLVEPFFGNVLWENREYERQFYINNGHGGGDNGWIPGDTWYAGQVLPPRAVQAQPALIDLNGVWQGDDGGSYYIRQISNGVYWYGEQSAINPGWSNVATGSINGNNLNLHWVDVPKGYNIGQGTLALVVENSGNTLRAQQRTGGFGGSTWNRISPSPPGANVRVVYVLPAPPSEPSAFDLTGRWQGNDGGTYYIRHIGSGIWWYGEQAPENPGWSNAAQGNVGGNVVNLFWFDVPKGRSIGLGRLALVVENSGNTLRVQQTTGGFGGSTWTRIG
jgi:hypothetical protein